MKGFNQYLITVSENGDVKAYHTIDKYWDEMESLNEVSFALSTDQIGIVPVDRKWLYVLYRDGV